MALRNVLNPPTNWENEVTLGMQCWMGTKMNAYTCHMVLGSVVYNIWRIRNVVRYANHPKLKSNC
jgi:hypothetical protein